jgi:putative heme-binding domain-containing protein
LGALRDTNAVPDLLAAWNSEETRSQGLEALARVSDARALEAYLEALSGGNAALREQVRQALGPIRDEVLPELEKRAGAMKPEVLVELRRVYEGHAAAAAGPLFTLKRGGLESADYERYAMQHDGDARSGQGLFFDETRAACVKCHAVGGQGGAVGPDLTLIGAQFPRATLIEHVLDPSKVVREGYQQVQIELRDGEGISGLLSAETADALTLIDGEARRRIVSRADIVNRSLSRLSLMPEGLQAGMTPEQFANLIAYLESRRTDPRQPGNQPAPEGFISLFNGRDMEGWREFPDQPPRVSRSTPGAPAVRHWLAREGVLEHDGKEGDLWTEREFGDFTLRLEWRWSDRPVWEDFPLIGADGLEQRLNGRPVTERVLDAGDSGVFLRGFRKAQANLFCYPVGSGEVWEYRTDPNMTPQQRRAVTPRRKADAPIGDWNRMEITLRGQRLTVVLNGDMVISDAALPGIPARGPVGLQHEHGRIQFRNLWIREEKDR